MRLAIWYWANVGILARQCIHWMSHSEDHNFKSYHGRGKRFIL